MVQLLEIYHTTLEGCIFFGLYTFFDKYLCLSNYVFIVSGGLVDFKLLFMSSSVLM